MNDVQENFKKDLRQVMEYVENMLIQKNEAYGDSALNPVRIFSKSDTIEQINVRMDDKLSRLARGDEAGEDVYMDLVGYLVIREIAKLRQARVDNGIIN
jgi:hypothetical protein